jgi:hypothetical protein
MTASTYSHRVALWVDDDGPERFPYEEFLLERSGWKVRWASSVAEAMERLRRDCFDAVVLDQFLPLRSSETGHGAGAWGGCLLLYWLRGVPPPAGAPETTALDEDKGGNDPPREENRGVRVVIVSAFFDAEVAAAISDLPGTVAAFAKPIEVQALIDYLR